MTHPRHICRILGHRREAYRAGWYFDWRGRQRERWHARCTRCGTSDGATVYESGLIEAVAYAFRRPIPRAVATIRSWWRTDCFYCHKPERRFGRPVGDHRDCIPF